jgi:hypothetical protein
MAPTRGKYHRDFLRSLHVEVCEIPEPVMYRQFAARARAPRRPNLSRRSCQTLPPLLKRSLWYLAFVAGVGLSVGLALRLGGW